MEQQAIVEPVEEVGYKNRPPLLEDVSIEGPFRIPIPHALDTLEQRETIEDDYNWWRYSSLALPCLAWLLLLFCVLFTLTALEQVGSIQELKDGKPTYFQLQADSSDKEEGNMRKTLRNLRISTIWLCLAPSILALLVLFARPRPNTRKLLHFLCAFLLFCGMVLAWISFGIGESESRAADQCPEMNYFTKEKCDKRYGQAVVSNILDFLLAISSLTAFFVLGYTTSSGDFKLLQTGWRQQERDMETEGEAKNVHNVKAHRVRQTRLAMTLITLFFVILFAIVQVAFIVVLHQDHKTVQLRSLRGRANRTYDIFSEDGFEEPGWPAKNTRLRYAISATGILTILLNLLPWRSRVIAYLFAFIYAALFTMTIVQFAIDVHELRMARREYYPGCKLSWLQGVQGDQLVDADLPDQKINCINSPYVCTAIFDMFIVVSLLFYVVNEYILRYQSIHSGRKYTRLEIRKIEKEQDSRRPVRCEMTSEVMTAAEYYYRHRFLTEPEMMGGASSDSSSGGFPAIQYDPVMRN